MEPGAAQRTQAVAALARVQRALHDDGGHVGGGAVGGDDAPLEKRASQYRVLA